MMDELKACPFCGSENVQISPYDGGKTAICMDCLCRAPMYRGDDALEKTIATWNRRPAPENKLLTVEQLRQMDTDMKTRPWVWIEVLKPYQSDEKISAYYRVQSDYTRGRAFCCGYPGAGFSFDYSDYGKTWLAYAHNPEQEEK